MGTQLENLRFVFQHFQVDGLLSDTYPIAKYVMDDGLTELTRIVKELEGQLVSMEVALASEIRSGCGSRHVGSRNLNQVELKYFCRL